MRKVLAAMLATSTMVSCSSEVASIEYETIGSIERLDPALDAIVPPGAVLEILAEGHEWTEGPVWVPALEAMCPTSYSKRRVRKRRTRSIRWWQPRRAPFGRPLSGQPTAVENRPGQRMDLDAPHICPRTHQVRLEHRENTRHVVYQNALNLRVGRPAVL